MCTNTHGSNDTAESRRLGQGITDTEAGRSQSDAYIISARFIGVHTAAHAEQRPRPGEPV